MEKFKACEKEMKTKAFSKEGLTQAAKLDPKEQEKEEAMQWLQSMVEELQMQVEAAEAQVEALQSTGKKKKASNTAGRMEELEQLNDRRKWHISRLEIILRLLNNGSLTTDRVNALKDDVQYFVESNTVRVSICVARIRWLMAMQEEDFDEDEGIYDELRLDEEEEKFGLLNDEDDASESASEGTVPPCSPSAASDLDVQTCRPERPSNTSTRKRKTRRRMSNTSANRRARYSRRRTSHYEVRWSSLVSPCPLTGPCRTFCRWYAYSLLAYKPSIKHPP